METIYCTIMGYILGLYRGLWIIGQNGLSLVDGLVMGADSTVLFEARTALACSIYCHKGSNEGGWPFEANLNFTPTSNEDVSLRSQLSTQRKPAKHIRGLRRCFVRIQGSF